MLTAAVILFCNQLTLEVLLWKPVVRKMTAGPNIILPERFLKLLLEIIITRPSWIMLGSGVNYCNCPVELHHKALLRHRALRLASVSFPASAAAASGLLTGFEWDFQSCRGQKWELPRWSQQHFFRSRHMKWRCLSTRNMKSSNINDHPG